MIVDTYLTLVPRNRLWGGFGLAVCLSFFYATAFSQNAKIDSLNAVLADSYLSDTARITVLSHLAWHYGKKDLGKSIHCYHEIIDLTLQLRDTIRHIHALNNLGLAYNSKQDYAKAENYLRESLDLSKSKDYERGVINGICNLAVVYRMIGDFKKANQFIQWSFSMKKNIGDSLGMAKSLMEWSILSRIHHDFDNAMNYTSQAKHIFESLGNQQGIANAIYELSIIERKNGELDAALRHRLQALDIYKSTADHKNVAKCYNSISNIYQDKGNYPLALSYLKQSLEIEQRLNSSTFLTHNNIATIYRNMGDLDKALAHSTLPENKDHAIKDIQSLYKNLSLIYEDKNQLDSALKYRKLYQNVRDSIFNIEQMKQMEQMKIRFNLSRKEEQIALQKDKIKLMAEKEGADRDLRISLATIAVLLLLLSVFIYSRYRLKKRSSDTLVIKNSEIAAKNRQIADANQELEKRMLRAQMDPHFIFNSLNSIQHFITVNDKHSAIRYLSKFSKLIRQMLENSVNVNVPIIDEIKLLEHYIELEALRFNHCFEYDINIDSEIDIYTTEIPFLLIQPYVENAIVHGLLPRKEKDSQLHIKLYGDDKKLFCKIKDNGIGRSAAQKIKARKKQVYRSRAMSLTQQRLMLLNKEKSDKTLVKIVDLFDRHQYAVGTEVTISIPL